MQNNMIGTICKSCGNAKRPVLLAVGTESDMVVWATQSTVPDAEVQVCSTRPSALNVVSTVP